MEVCPALKDRKASSTFFCQLLRSERLLKPPWIVIACYWLVMIYYLGAQWSFYESYNYGWAVPFLSLYLLWERLRATDIELPTPNSSLPQAESPLRIVTNPWLLVLLCALLYVPTRMVHEATPGWRLITLVWVLEILGLTLALIWAYAGRGRMEVLAPGIGFFLVAVPWLPSIEGVVQRYLAGFNVCITVELLQFWNIPALQKGNIIELSTGFLGIEKACSGIQSLQASIMISLFFGILHRLGFWRILLLLFSSAGLAFSFNVFRTTILGIIAAHHGIDAANKWHDMAGVAILLACFVSLWAIACFMRTRIEITGHGTMGKRSQLSQKFVASQPGHLRCRALALFMWLVFAETGIELWFRAHERLAEKQIRWAVNWPIENGSFKQIALKPELHQILKFNIGESGQWREEDGSCWQAFFFAWVPARSFYERLGVSPYHNPEGCNKAAGWKVQARLSPVEIPAGKGCPLIFRRMVFENDGQTMHLFLAVTDYNKLGASPSSLRITPRDRVQAALSGSRLYGQRTLEIAVSGIEDPEEAKASLQRQLEKIIVVQSRPPI